jgi:protein-tyrosine phosphatase
MGNICRSPMAHGLLQNKIEQIGLQWQVDSAGTSGYHKGEQPDNRAISCMKKHNIDITYQHSRPFQKADFAKFDVIYCMDKHNFWDVRALAENADEESKVLLILNEVTPDLDASVPDPYYGSGDGFEHVYRMLDKATDKIIEKYK